VYWVLDIGCLSWYRSNLICVWVYVYRSPSGCTFWGKKQWSKKKKILLQLAMLVGGPIGISFIAVAAIPAIIIGLPVWIGRKVLPDRELISCHYLRWRHSVVVSPLVALINVVNRHWARLVLGWVTVCG